MSKIRSARIRQVKFKHQSYGVSFSIPTDEVNRPKHYNTHPAGIECIDVVEHMAFNLGNAIKYLWRHENKNGLQDLDKAIWYIQREKERLLQQSYAGIRDQQKVNRGPR